MHCAVHTCDAICCMSTSAEGQLALAPQLWLPPHVGTHPCVCCVHSHTCLAPGWLMLKWRRGQAFLGREMFEHTGLSIQLL